MLSLPIPVVITPDLPRAVLREVLTRSVSSLLQIKRFLLLPLLLLCNRHLAHLLWLSLQFLLTQHVVVRNTEFHNEARGRFAILPLGQLHLLQVLHILLLTQLVISNQFRQHMGIILDCLSTLLVQVHQRLRVNARPRVRRIVVQIAKTRQCVDMLLELHKAEATRCLAFSSRLVARNLSLILFPRSHNGLDNLDIRWDCLACRSQLQFHSLQTH